MDDQNAESMPSNVRRAWPVFTCEICGKRATRWIDAQQGFDPGNERWVPRCNECHNVPVNRGKRMLQMIHFY
jgi:hypothetical protein